MNNSLQPIEEDSGSIHIDEVDTALFSEDQHIHHNSNQSSIRLSQLDPQSRDRLAKFDISNDGALQIEEALQGLITLQKQSNNYRKILMMLIPVFILTLLCVFGLTVLALNITKQLHVSSDASLTTSSGNIARAAIPLTTTNIYHNVWGHDVPTLSGSLKSIEIGGTSLKIQSIHRNITDKTTYLHTALGVITMDSHLNMTATVYSHLSNDMIATQIMTSLNDILRYSASSMNKYFTELAASKVASLSRDDSEIGFADFGGCSYDPITWELRCNTFGGYESSISGGGAICDPKNVCTNTGGTSTPPPPPPPPSNDE